MGNAVVGAEVAHGVNLVLHQRYQRGYHYGCAFHQQRWQLITERFATACGHEDEHVVPSQKREHYLLLVAFEFVKPEV